ncbi:SDR family oxidoreductase [Kitasatospora sp. NPDC096077]|uniref:SDR family oxidoreductase n=1 Tax=Kitasatospora sp. NPDC096077 TaxID=3155544 RepID=UPI00332C7CEA
MPHFTDGLYDSQTVLITGGATGIGFAMARAFGLHGAQVVLASRNAERLSAAAGRLTALGIENDTVVCDVRDEAAVKAAVARTVSRFGTIDVLVNNAAANFWSPAETMSSRSFRTVVEIDLFGTFHTTRAVVPHMIEQRRGVILNVAITDPQRGLPSFAHAAAAKSGVLALTTTWAAEWGRYGIRVNALGPGPTVTENAVGGMAAGRPDHPPSFELQRRRTPLRRLATPEDSASAALFLCSDAAEFITGVNLPVDGGISLPTPSGDLNPDRAAATPRQHQETTKSE